MALLAVRRRLFLLCTLSLQLLVVGGNEVDEEACPSDIPKSCRLLFSRRPTSLFSSHSSPYINSDDNAYNNRKYGIYSAAAIPKNHPLTLPPGTGDLVIHLIDVAQNDSNNNDDNNSDINSSSSQQLLKWKKYGYIQDAITSGHGGNYEGLGEIWTVLPGVAMLSAFPPHSKNDKERRRPNVWASIPENDESTHPRYKSPLSGSFALYYNLTFQVTSDEGLNVGDEVWVDRTGWYRRQALLLWNKDKAVDEDKQVVDGNHDDDDSNDNNKDESTSATMSMDNLFNHGTCLDNIYPGTSPHGYGRAALAFRFIPRGSIVAPVPVLPLPRDELNYLRLKERKRVMSFRERWMKERKGERGTNDDVEEDVMEERKEDELPPVLPPDMTWRQQLLLNYCYGHEHSSVLLFPYGVFVNYINHAPTTTSPSNNYESSNNNRQVANVKLQWSERFMNTTATTSNDLYSDLRTLTPSRLWEQSTPPEGLVLELVALKDIQPDEEILLDYGSIWSKAWKDHQDQYTKNLLQLADGHKLEEEYSPAYVMDDVVKNLRTVEEQVHFPYPDNVFTACFYRYDGRQPHENKTTITTTSSSSTAATIKEDPVNKNKMEATPWKMSPGLFDMTNLRPCKVISREPANDRFASTRPNQQQQPPQGKMVYTAIIQNRPGLELNERIPKGTKHIVSGIPRGAFRFVDRPYTSDVHLEGAFRHDIGLEELGIYPEIWLDMKSA
jgi:hypothetical protein